MSKSRYKSEKEAAAKSMSDFSLISSSGGYIIGIQLEKCELLMERKTLTYSNVI